MEIISWYQTLLNIWERYLLESFTSDEPLVPSSVVRETSTKMFRPLVFIFLVIMTIELVSSRVFYVDNPRSNYYPDESGTGQASRDLDMTFSAGEPGENEEGGVYPLKKTIIYPSAERSPYDPGHESDRPIYYRLADVPARRVIYADPLPYERSRKLVKFNNPHKGEVVLELRVIANNNNEV